MKIKFLLFIILFYSCKHQSRYNFYKPGSKISDSFKRDFGDNGELTVATFKWDINAPGSALDSLENGYPTLQMRFWFPDGVDNHRQLIFVIKQDKEKRVGQLHDIHYIMDSTGYILKDRKQVIKKLEPTCGWDNLLDTLFSLNVMTLKNQYFNGTTESFAPTIFVEISNRQHYRLYLIEAPLSRKDEDSENMVAIMDLLERQFGFSRVKKF
jgi:hypothetical protein